MQISSENYINVLIEQVKALTIENTQLKAHILDLQAQTQKDDNEKDASDPAG